MLINVSFLIFFQFLPNVRRGAERSTNIRMLLANVRMLILNECCTTNTRSLVFAAILMCVVSGLRKLHLPFFTREK